MDALANEVYQALLMDLLLAAGLLVLFLYLARLSREVREVRGVALWGWMHFCYTLGTTLLDAVAPMLAAAGHPAAADVLRHAGVLVASLAMTGLAWAMVLFVRQRPLRPWELGLMPLSAALVLATWLGWDTRGAQTMALTVVELGAFTLIGWHLRALNQAPARVPARLMLAGCAVLGVLYGSVIPGWTQGLFGFDDVWVSVDVSSWFMLNFCMLMLASFRAAEGLRRSAMTDPLTGALNRRGFEDALQADIAREGATACAAISLDIDHFKVINDTHGHAAGDDVLARLADAVRAQLRAGDLFERAGGDEFVILLHGVDQGVALGIAERVRAAVKAQAMHGQAMPGDVTLSIGVHAEPGLSVENLVRRADAALYRAKEAGRACVSGDGRLRSDA